jgi:hypothetical protein
MKKVYPRTRRSQRKYDLMWHYGMTIDEYDILFNKQKGKCALCQKPFKKVPYVDHDHKTGEVRGLLCYKCNTGLGFLGDNKKGLLKALEYLKGNHNVS